MAASVGGRSMFMRSVRSISRSSRSSSPSIAPNFMLRHTPVPPPPRPSSSSRWLPRQLSSLLPVHSAVASACLVSNLTAEPTTSIQGYVKTREQLNDIFTKALSGDQVDLQTI